MKLNKFIKELAAIMPAKSILSDPSECWVYGYDNSSCHVAPDVVVFPQCHQDVQATVNLCNQYKLPLVARGRGTGTPGGSVPIANGVVMSFERMAKVLAINQENRYAIVEPGVINQDLQLKAADNGFFFAPDPTSSAYCTIGGNLSYNSAGPRAIKYGTTRDNTLGLTAVTGDGRTITTGTRTTKGVVGYDLTRLLIGSEGTLAIITKAIVKLIPKPAATCSIRTYYADINSATRAIVQLMQQAITPCALEFIDNNALNALREHGKLAIPNAAQALLMIAVDGSKHSIHHDVATLKAVANNDGCIDIASASTEQESKQLWATRKSLSPILRTIAPKKINEDVVVPIANIPALISGLEQLATQFAINIVNFGHAGNGNIHVNLLLDPKDDGALVRAQACLEQVFSLVLALDGTLSGEHGVGLAKQDFIHQEVDANSLALMKQMKQVFDPNNILNPGKIWPVAD